MLASQAKPHLLQASRLVQFVLVVFILPLTVFKRVLNVLLALILQLRPTVPLLALNAKSVPTMANLRKLHAFLALSESTRA
jgi:hypothetical protein